MPSRQLLYEFFETTHRSFPTNNTEYMFMWISVIQQNRLAKRKAVFYYYKL